MLFVIAVPKNLEISQENISGGEVEVVRKALLLEIYNKLRGGSRAAATSKMEGFVIIVNVFQTLTIITKRSILDVVAALNPPLKFLLLINSTV